jgi:EAL domain-containing protein (putative c-di-GMP-specific phosphodiesterase class I)/GGDEF domain-containing protein
MDYRLKFLDAGQRDLANPLSRSTVHITLAAVEKSPVAPRLPARTGPPDRGSLFQRASPATTVAVMNRSIRAARLQNTALALVLVDFDSIWLVCKMHDPAVCDEAMQVVTTALRSVACSNAVISPQGNTGFLTLLVKSPSVAEAAVSIRAALDAIAAPRLLGGHGLRITTCAGIAMFPKDGETLATLKRRAGIALREAKRAHPGAVRQYSPAPSSLERRQVRLEADLREAIASNALSLYYQPQFETSSGAISGVEVLSRWFRRGRAAIEPSEFIPLAEKTQLIAELGSWALETACMAVQQWKSKESQSILVCVNVSPHQLNEGFIRVIQQALHRSGMPAARLELEITESALIGNSAVIDACFQRIKELGARIAIDDFGVGYSSLGYLSRLPVDRLKLDRSLIHNLSSHWKDVAILRSIISLGKELDVAVIAEGVETEQQFQELKRLGCRQVQGYWLARPAPGWEIDTMLARAPDSRCTAPPRSCKLVPEWSHAS